MNDRTWTATARIFLLAAAVAAGVPALASGGRVPIGSVPFVITEPGHYYVTADLAASGGCVIEVRASNVTIDLAGHTVTQQSTASSSAALCTDETNVVNLAVRNGHLVGGEYGLRAYLGTDSRLELQHLLVTGHASYGVFASRYGAATSLLAHLEDVTVVGGAWNGVTLSGLKNSVIESCTVRGCVRQGIELDGSGILVRRNAISGTGQNCINATGDGIRIAENVLTACSSTGVGAYGAGPFDVSDNHVTGCGSGVLLAIGVTASRVAGNVVSKSTWDGITVNGTNNTVDGNLSAGNSGRGLSFSGSGNIYANNRTPGNGGGGVYGGSAQTNGGGNY